MPLFCVISHTIHAAADAHNDWKDKSGYMRRREPHCSLVYSPVYKLATAIERQMSQRRLKRRPSSTSSEPSSPVYASPITTPPADGRPPVPLSVVYEPDSQTSYTEPHSPTRLELKLKHTLNDPPPPYPGLPPAQVSRAPTNSSPNDALMSRQ